MRPESGTCYFFSRKNSGANWAYLNVPYSLPQAMKPELVCDLGGVHGIGEILFVCKDEEKSITELIFVEHPLEFFPCFRNTLPIVRIDDEDDTLGILEICVTGGRLSETRKIPAGGTYNASKEDESCPDLRHPTR